MCDFIFGDALIVLEHKSCDVELFLESSSNNSAGSLEYSKITFENSQDGSTDDKSNDTSTDVADITVNVGPESCGSLAKS